MFDKVIQQLMTKSRWYQYQQPTLILPLKTDSAEECSFDGVRPAVGEVSKGDDQKPASQAVLKRREKGIPLRNDLYFELLGVIDAKFTNDLETLATRIGNLSGKIAFIHFDGNRFGRIRDELCRSETDMLEFQKLAEKTRRKALKAILTRALKEENKSFRTSEPDNEVRLETILWGGDEIEFACQPGKL